MHKDVPKRCTPLAPETLPNPFKGKTSPTPFSKVESKFFAMMMARDAVTVRSTLDAQGISEYYLTINF